MQLEDWLDDLCVRFIVNLPPEELASVERICFQVEEAQWFYEDFIRPLDPSLPSLSLKTFSLRIFQHCPLFSTWSTQHYTSAFAEFMAYKQRVPVRGAIMLNEEMDEVVLVKGWKKGANWSFPRGKINKDENDLDCAVREVYEETGYDIQSAGLVKPEKDTKYIEVTMREQHMRLYVFRGVPKDTHFEPKTRKEISKVEWYKLTDLPTLKKKHPHHDAQDESHPLNANKFYMVAPFLHPLKKWIAQQKKKENRFSSSHLAAPPMMMMDESATEGEPGPSTHVNYQPNILSPSIPSSLPEVAHVSHLSTQDPSSHLKELLNIGLTSQPAAPSTESTGAPVAHAAKSNALLALLRSGPPVEMRSNPQTPLEQTFVQPQAPQSPQTRPIAPAPTIDTRQPPPTIPLSKIQVPNQQRSLLDLFANASIQKPQDIDSLAPSDVELPAPSSERQIRAPYQRTGDPHFTRDSPEEAKDRIVPPANALPTLTHHTRALLDAFKVIPSPAPQVFQSSQKVDQPPLASNKQALLNAFKSPIPTPQPKPVANTSQSDTIPPVSVTDPQYQRGPQTTPGPSIKIQSSNASSLLSLFNTQNQPALSTKVKTEESPQLPVELAAGPALSPKPLQTRPPADLLSLMRKDAPKRAPQAIKAGETAATLDGPMNQPHFEGISKSPSQISADSMRRSPAPAHRTLYDPKQPAPTKILQRPEESKRVQAKSPRPPKANLTVASPKQKSRAKSEKPFQPQILRRPQISEKQDDATPSPTLIASTDDLQRLPSPTPLSVTASPIPIEAVSPSPPSPIIMTRRASQQTESQKQNLLSLLTGQTGPANASKTSRQTPLSGAVSPLTQSQIVSPLAEEPPISTRSRMSSLASITSPSLPPYENRAKVEKRQTTAGDKAFLLGYLGRIASQEGHAQQ